MQQKYLRPMLLAFLAGAILQISCSHPRAIVLVDEAFALLYPELSSRLMAAYPHPASKALRISESGSTVTAAAPGTISQPQSAQRPGNAAVAMPGPLVTLPIASGELASGIMSIEKAGIQWIIASPPVADTIASLVPQPSGVQIVRLLSDKSVGQQSTATLDAVQAYRTCGALFGALAAEYLLMAAPAAPAGPPAAPTAQPASGEVPVAPLTALQTFTPEATRLTEPPPPNVSTPRAPVHLVFSYGLGRGKAELDAFKEGFASSFTALAPGRPPEESLQVMVVEDMKLAGGPQEQLQAALELAMAGQPKAIFLAAASATALEQLISGDGIEVGADLRDFGSQARTLHSRLFASIADDPAALAQGVIRNTRTMHQQFHLHVPARLHYSAKAGALLRSIRRKAPAALKP